MSEKERKMKESRIVSLIGLAGLLIFIYGGFILFEPSSTFGSIFRLSGAIIAFFPVFYLWRKDK